MGLTVAVKQNKKVGFETDKFILLVVKFSYQRCVTKSVIILNWYVPCLELPLLLDSYGKSKRVNMFQNTVRSFGSMIGNTMKPEV